MTKLVGVHALELRPGVDPAAFEQVCAEVVGVRMYPGWSTRILKGERGARAGKYAVVFEIDSVEDRDRIFPEPDQHSAEAQQFDNEHPESSAVWDRLFELVDLEADVVTDYLIVAE
ncbi:hypothetical protein [Microlunatus ginsengisoli]|uniref:NIPSNAP protein n=1 Tax=Microlunatus ginsengisoli TaxID=363863 RepID=A0ABP7A8F2_9ACTN